MTDLLIITREVGYDSGVIVSIRHLAAVLEQAGISVRTCRFSTEEELWELAREAPEACLNIHVPSFKDETLAQIMTLGKPVLLSIHSTLCNLQTEAGLLERIFRMGRLYGGQLLFSCPSGPETEAMNALHSGQFIHLPNAFSYPLLTEAEAGERAAQRLAERSRQIGMFSAYRPFKNLPVQLAAASLCAGDFPLELHFSHGTEQNPLYRAMRELSEAACLPAVFHEQMSNGEFYASLDDISVLMQVSLSETLSYVALEHMARGIPVVGSASIPFATWQADYSDVQDIADKLRLALAADTYQENVSRTLARARQVVTANNQGAVARIREFIGGAYDR